MKLTVEVSPVEFHCNRNKICRLTAGKLLPSLNKDTSEGAEEDLVVGEFEAVEISAGTKSSFGFKISLNFVELNLNIVGTLGKASKAAERCSSFFFTATLDEPTRGLNGKKKLDGDNKRLMGKFTSGSKNIPPARMAAQMN